MQNQQIKAIGTNGQLSLGKAFAGQQVIIDQIDEGTWIIKTGQFIPHSEQWLHIGKHGAKLDKAIEWAEKHKPVDNFDKIARDLEKDK